MNFKSSLSLFSWQTVLKVASENIETICDIYSKFLVETTGGEHMGKYSMPVTVVSTLLNLNKFFLIVQEHLIKVFPDIVVLEIWVPNQSVPGNSFP